MPEPSGAVAARRRRSAFGSAIPTSWLELDARRRAQSPGAAHDGRGRACRRCALSARSSGHGRSTGSTGSGARYRCWQRAIIARRSMTVIERSRRAPTPFPRFPASARRPLPSTHRRIDDPPPARPPDARPDRRATPRVYGPADHPVRRDQLSRGARDVTRKLQEAGFKAFIVGGAVRDLLLGIDAQGLRHRDRRDARSRSSRSSAARSSSAAASAWCTCTPAPRRSRCRRFARAQTGDDVDRRARPAAVRQRLRLAGRGRRAARLHDQRAVLRSRDRGSLGLRRRRGRHPRAAPEADRRRR